MRIDDTVSRIIREVADETGFTAVKVKQVVIFYYDSIYSAIKNLKAYKITVKFLGHFITNDTKLSKTLGENADKSDNTTG